MPSYPAQALHRIQLLIESLGAAANTWLLKLLQPLSSMPDVVDVSSCTRNRPTAIQRFQPAHYPDLIFHNRQIAPRQFAQHSHSRLAVVNRLQMVATQ